MAVEARGRPVSEPDLMRDANAFLRSLVRMEIRKRERALARLARRPLQSDAEFDDFRRRQVEALQFRRGVLALLEDDRRALPPSLPV